jgi:DNA-binding GntR family transcriptional regulator
MDMVERLVGQIQHTSLHDAVYRELRRLLLTHRFEFGARLNTRELERLLGVSRTPLKDALNRLAAEGVVEVRPRRGYFVRQPTIDDVVELYDLRRLHESYAIERAALLIGEDELASLRAILGEQRSFAVDEPTDEQYARFSQLDREFHRGIVAAARNRRLAWLYDQMDAHIQMTRLYYPFARTMMPVTFREHLDIFEALEARDAQAAKTRLVQHIERFRELAVRSLAERQAAGDARETSPDGRLV